ncbi:MAG: CHAP domain-containing protein [Ferrovibrionaceae bacterium]|jgi:hypothetical protein
MLNRRTLMQIATTGAAVTALPPLVVAQQTDATDTTPDPYDKVINVVQFGDPNLPRETLVYNPVRIMNAVNGVQKASFEPRIRDIRARLVAECAEHVGENRQNNRAEISEYLGLFNLPFNSNGTNVPFCAAGISYFAVKLYARQKGIGEYSTVALRSFLSDVDRQHFYPSPSVADMKNVALGKRRWLARAEAIGNQAPRAGWLVVYNWGGTGVPNHVGLVESVQGNQLRTIEFNTSVTTGGSNTDGGHVARRTRPLDSKVEGFILPELERLA